MNMMSRKHSRHLNQQENKGYIESPSSQYTRYDIEYALYSAKKENLKILNGHVSDFLRVCKAIIIGLKKPIMLLIWMQ